MRFHCRKFDPIQKNPIQRSQKSPTPTGEILNRMRKKYGSPQSLSDLQTINKILEIDLKQKAHKNTLNNCYQNVLLLFDSKFDEEAQIMTYFYVRGDSYHELSQLIDYYQYYLQDPVIFFSPYFQMMSKFYERKKNLVFQEFREKFIISKDEIEIKNQMTGKNANKKVLNLLAEITLTHSFQKNISDESLHLRSLHHDLMKFYGKSIDNIEQIDKLFWFKKYGKEKQVESSKEFHNFCQSSNEKEACETNTKANILCHNYRMKRNKKKFLKNNTSTKIMQSTNISHSHKRNSSQIVYKNKNIKLFQRNKSVKRFKSHESQEIMLNSNELIKFTPNQTISRKNQRRKSAQTIKTYFIDHLHDPLESKQKQNHEMKEMKKMKVWRDQPPQNIAKVIAQAKKRINADKEEEVKKLKELKELKKLKKNNQKQGKQNSRK